MFEFQLEDISDKYPFKDGWPKCKKCAVNLLIMKQEPMDIAAGANLVWIEHLKKKHDYIIRMGLDGRIMEVILGSTRSIKILKATLKHLK